ncbi:MULTISPECIES: LysR family transcriptional regulator [Pseudomonas]|uniref:LysR family transcriptional regulator n=2 Tax=Pseudomonas protegens TaxID=380021 RepID=A0A9Q6IBB8_9PSED|nr:MULTISPECIES: LysR family transcriptional regulator [Pseudomonas]MBS7562745.1 LysR family transcriptional regulator [Pseudomonas sp. RC4D1]MBW8355660.1 LysR family transcriptional regulator [Pseudomonas sp.]MCY7259830.1 LysR family transcriptional regulator [Pseudomonas protegens]MDC7818992.1 LysR family transcriptional regulator [Pseudomonas sp. BLCC-B112]MDD1017864.1 LysR family transcriptional regulator [Pseudomonas idahonensis]
MSFLEPAPHQGVAPYVAPQEPREAWLALAAGVDPEVAQYFLVSARCGCFMQAARSLNIKATLLRKQLALLEEHLRRSLFCYQGSALSLSREGLQLQAQLIALAHQRRLPVIEQPLIRVAVAQTILHDILGRDLIALLRRNASARLEIISIDSDLSLQALSADLVLWLAAEDSPLPGPSFATREPLPLARIDYLPHIAKRYSRVAARPDSLDDLADYMLVQWQHDCQVEPFRPWNSLVEQRLAGVVHVHVYELMLEMIRCSACIGLLPQYISHFDRGLTALPGLFSEPMQRRAWLAVNAQVQHEEQVQQLVELILNTFSEREDWFV